MIHFRAHETAICFFRTAYDRFAANVERCVDDDRATGVLFKCPDQIIIQGMVFPLDCLDACGVVNVCYRGNGRPRDVELVYAEQFILFVGHCDLQFWPHRGNQKHVRTCMIQRKEL